MSILKMIIQIGGGDRRDYIKQQYISTGVGDFNMICPDCNTEIAFTEDDFPIEDYTHPTCEGLPNQPLIVWGTM